MNTKSEQPRDGKALEQFVAFVEKTMAGQGFKVTTNRRVVNDNGVPVAEFDIEIEGKVGSTDFKWLIECRDRGAGGAAPGAWIEQLAGRRERFRFDKVTAVSASGFAEGAKEAAKFFGIELREVHDLHPDAFASWLETREFHSTIDTTNLSAAKIVDSGRNSPEIKAAFEKTIKSTEPNSAFLKKVTTGEFVTAHQAFLGIVTSQQLFEKLKVASGAPPYPVELRVEYEEDDYFVVETEAGDVRVESIVFKGDLTRHEETVVLVGGSQYVRTDEGKLISQVARFAVQQIGHMKMGLEMHKIEDTGEIHIVMRRHDK